jgi:hypothetical protein
LPADCGIELGPSTDRDGLRNAVLSWEDVERGILDADRFDPDENEQHGVGDCWLIGVLNGLMETSEGDQLLRDNVRWDEANGCYWVRLYDSDGRGEWIEVDQVINGGAT